MKVTVVRQDSASAPRTASQVTLGGRGDLADPPRARRCLRSMLRHRLGTATYTDTPQMIGMVRREIAGGLLVFSAHDGRSRSDFAVISPGAAFSYAQLSDPGDGLAHLEDYGQTQGAGTASLGDALILSASRGSAERPLTADEEAQGEATYQAGLQVALCWLIDHGLYQSQ